MYFSFVSTTDNFWQFYTILSPIIGAGGAYKREANFQDFKGHLKEGGAYYREDLPYIIYKAITHNKKITLPYIYTYYVSFV